ncbi:hypothetical protein [Paenibacillus chibensis]|uniref:hypothetical protein n=2 Tax=Paenibacillus chibensis TaxID=59846 RepID=UPI003D2BEB99
MKKAIVYITCMLLMLPGCQTGGSASNQTADRAAAAPVRASSPNQGQERPAQSQGSAQTEDVVISDVGAWDHPVKKVFAAHGVKLGKVVLQQSKTYPVFYVDMPPSLSDSNNQGELRRLLADLAQANAYWSFSIADSAGSPRIDVVCDRKRQLVMETAVDGRKKAWTASEEEQRSDEGRDSFAAYVAGASAQTVKLDVRAQGDLDGDGAKEKIVTYQERNYVVKTKGSVYAILGELVDPIAGIEHMNVKFAIQPLTPGKEPYIVVYAENEGEAKGFSVYRLIGGRVGLVKHNYPDATNRGERLLKDVDGDGVYDSVSIFGYDDLQQHVVTVYEPFNGTKPEAWKVAYRNETGSFVYPETAEDVVRNWIEDQISPEYFGSEIGQLASTPQARTFPIEQDLNPNVIHAYGGDNGLSYETLRNEEDLKVIRAAMGEGEGTSVDFTLNRSEGKWRISAISAVQKQN